MKKRSKNRGKPAPSKARAPSWHRAVRMVVAIALLAYGLYLMQKPPAEEDCREAAPASAMSEERSTEDAPSVSPGLRTLVRDRTIRNQDGRVIYRGDVDLSPTLVRIERDERLATFPHDGMVFQNREGRLPAKPAGYYREWVHATPGVEGPGPQRIVSGADGEFWYTPDHYETFIKLHGADP